MSEWIPSDHDAVDSHRVRVEGVGRTDRPAVPIPEAVDLSAGDRCIVSLAGTETYAVVESDFDGQPRITSVAASRSTAGSHTDRLADWLETAGIETGRSVRLDVITPGYKIGLRAPGATVRYRTRDPPDRSLAEIAREYSE